MIALDDIRRSFRGRISLSEPMAKYTTFRIGGPADVYLEPIDKQDAVALLSVLERESTPCFIMGNGSNILISDEGIQGAVVNLEAGLTYLRYEDGVVTAGAGVKLAKFVDFCIEHERQGAEMLAGIPGTLGGAIIMNAGAYGGEISDYMIEVDVVRDGRAATIPREQAGFAYRTSALQGDRVLEARFRFPDGEPQAMKELRKSTLIRRKTSQPVQWPNAGSIFKNPPGDYAARLIQECGLKGRRVGGAEISELHANFIINRGDARAADVLELIRIARHEVMERFSIELELEIKLVGFSAQMSAVGTGGEAGR